MAPFAIPVLDLVLMGRYPHRGRLERERDSDLDKARRALSYVGLSGFEDRYFNELSGGERQLAMFARVLAQDTQLLLLDEPTSNLDIRHQDLFFSMALELTREGRAVVACVHDLDVASQYCSRLVLLNRGRVAAEGAAAAGPEARDPGPGVRDLHRGHAQRGHRQPERERGTTFLARRRALACT